MDKEITYKWTVLDKRNELSELLKAMEVPAFRTDLTKMSNIHWLNRNIAINNEGPVLEKARTLIKDILKERS